MYVVKILLVVGLLFLNFLLNPFLEGKVEPKFGLITIPKGVVA
jgi:hypothetical protein